MSRLLKEEYIRAAEMYRHMGRDDNPLRIMADIRDGYLFRSCVHDGMMAYEDENTRYAVRISDGMIFSESDAEENGYAGIWD